MSEGVDLYGLYNKVNDWDAVRAAGIEFAWVKLSDGNTNRDDYGYVAGGRGVGIAMGGYHYAQPGDPVAQADRLIGRCTAEGALDLAPALDLEAPFVPGKTAVDFAIAFLLRIQERGHVPCLYANNSMLLGVLGAVRKAVPGVKVWGARYGASLTVPVDVHQYTSTGRVAGIAGDVDRNRGSIIRNTTTPPPQEDDVQLTEMLNFPDHGSPGPDGKPIVHEITVGDALRRMLANTEALPEIKATGAATLATAAAIHNDPDITEARLTEIVKAAAFDAIRDNIQITGSVEITGSKA